MSCNPSNSQTNSQISGQCWPKTGHLHNNLDRSLDILKSHLQNIQSDNNAVVYSYVIDTIKKTGGSFVQKGCGPNFEGDFITLCTCKHRMRTYKNIDFWKNKWIAGFSGLEAGDRKNVLIYLMQVGQAFESQYDLWHSGVLSKKELRAKNSQFNKLGDLYEPSRPSLKGDQRFQTRYYEKPPREHAHFKKNEWHKDIDYRGCGNRRPALLIGKRKHSFLWKQPTIFLPKGKLGKGDIGRTEPKKKLSEFLEALKEG